MPTSKRNTLLLTAFALACMPVRGAANAFSIDQVMSAPFASSMLAAPTGAKVGWLLNEQGRRNVWVALGPEWKGHKVTSFNQDDGQEIDEVVWAHDGSYLLFTHGGDFEMGRSNPNPSVMLTKPDQSIWSVAFSGGPAKKLTEGHAAAISPKGDLVAFLREGQIWLMKPSGEGVVNAATQLGVTSNLTWSPDGSALAFVSTRHEHSFIGVYDPAEKSIHYLDPSVDRDESPVWSPDGTRIAYLRIAASTREFSFGPEREGEPWSIRVADCKSGAGTEIFHADKGRGSVFSPVDAASQIFWAADDRVVFPWEKTGWRHLYSVSVGGGAAAELTPGEGEVEHVFMQPGASKAYFSANFLDIDRRHVWAVDTSGKQPPLQLTKGETIEWAPVPAADGSALLFLASSYDQKAHAAVQIGSGAAQALAPESVPADFPAALLVKPQPVIFTASDGMPIHAQLFLPPAGGPQRHAALLFFHGGSRRQMLLGFHYMDYYSNAYAMNQYLASQGYVVLAVNYRSGIGYGLDFREALNYGATGASEFNDVTGAALYMKSRPDVDPTRVGLWGGSYGGYLTALGLARASDMFAAGVDFHGVHDWNEVIENFNPGYDAQKQAAAAKLAFDSSPLAAVKTWRSPVLLIHGDDDRNVPFSETVHLVEALRKQNVVFEELIFPNEIHDFLLHRDWVTAYKATADFFDRKLK
jgi:dipeptidyl aminopeptidase/acylaminoacyl peptidase